MNEFNLYRLTNIGADQVDNPMKRAALLLGFIQGEDVKDWVKHWTIWALDQYNTGLASTDEHYWNTVARAFETSFQDTGATERAEENSNILPSPQGKLMDSLPNLNPWLMKQGMVSTTDPLLPSSPPNSLTR